METAKEVLKVDTPKPIHAQKQAKQTGSEGNYRFKWTAKLKAPINERKGDMLKAMSLFKEERLYKDSLTAHSESLCQHPCSRLCADTLIETLLKNLPEWGHLYDVGAKYASMRKIVSQYRPNLIYHGIRCPVSVFDRSYIDSHPPHEEDRIYKSYDEFYDHLEHLPRASVLMFVDSAYYVTEH